MNTCLRFFWIISLAIFTAGCSGFQTACFPPPGDPGDGLKPPWDFCDLHPGDRARITFPNGDKVVGRVEHITPDWIILQEANSSKSRLLISPSQVLSIEISSSGSSEDREIEQPEIGDVVSLYLTDGSRVEGEVLVFNDLEIVLDHKGQSSQPRSYAMDQVLWLTVADNGGGSSWVVPVVGALVVVLAVGGIALANSMQDMVRFGN